MLKLFHIIFFFNTSYISLLSRTFFAFAIIECDKLSFFSEFFNDCCFFALSCVAHFSCLKAIRFFITSFSALIYSFSALKRISSSRSDSVKGNGFFDFLISSFSVPLLVVLFYFLPIHYTLVIYICVPIDKAFRC